MVETGFLEFPCTLCGNFGMWITPKGDVQPCPVIARGDRHAEPNAAAKLAARAIEIMQRNGQYIDCRQFDLVRELSEYTSENPCDRKKILSDRFSYLPMSEANQLRRFHYCIEELRREWLLPVGSRKEEPSGYWIITDQADFEKWVRRTKSAPITQLSTIHKVAKRNFPIFAEQMELEFWNDIRTQDPRSAA